MADRYTLNRYTTDPLLRWLYTRWVMLLRAPLPFLVGSACVIVLAMGVLLLVEPIELLVERRRDSTWKVIPFLRSTEWFNRMADTLQQKFSASARSRACIRFILCIFLPISILVRLGLSLLDFAVLRSVVLLTFGPFVVLTCLSMLMVATGLFKNLGSRGAGAGAGAGAGQQQQSRGTWRSLNLRALILAVGGPGAAWIATVAVILFLFWLDPIRRSFVRWAFGDVPLGIYTIILAIVLCFSAVATALMTETYGEQVTAADVIDYQRTLGCSTLAASVVAMWIIRLMNPRLFSRRACMLDA